MPGRSFSFGFTTLVLWLTTVLSTHAQVYPSRPIKLVVPFAAGNDGLARQVAQQLSRVTGQPVIVENRPGANGMFAVRTVDQSPPDGYTLLWGASGLSDPRDFKAVASIASFPHVLIVSGVVPAKTAGELVAHAQANPGKLASGAVLGSPAYLMSGIFKKLANIDIALIPYRTIGNAMTDLLAGRTQMQFSPVAQIQPHIGSGMVRALALTSERRLDEPRELKDVSPHKLVNAW
jgi:tripartite-type tricarboxylate transporter receptor subunit TctC